MTAGMDIRDLSVSFGALAVLQDVSFSVAGGDVLGLIGPNGAGKTTLFNAASGFVAARGSVVLDDVELLRLPSWKRRNLGLGRTFQTPRLLLDSDAIENVSHGIPEIRQAPIIAQMIRTPGVRKTQQRALLHAHDLLDTIGFPYPRDVPLAFLPFGAQRFVEIARALALKPTVLLLDEPAAGLHIDERELLRKVLRALVPEDLCGSVVLIDHDMSLVTEVCSRIVVLDRGALLAEGSPPEIQRNSQVINAYLGEAPTREQEISV